MGTNGIVGMPVEKGGAFRHIPIAEASAQDFGNRLTAVLAAAAMLGHPVLHISTGVGVVVEGEPPQHWAHIVIYQPPGAVEAPTPSAPKAPAEPETGIDLERVMPESVAA